MRRATTIRKQRGRGRRTSAPAYSTTSGQIPPRTPHRMSVPSIVESLNAHRYFERRQAKSAMARLALDDDRTMYESSSRLTATPCSDTPPSYGSILSQIQENSSDCEDLHDFLFRTYRVLWSTGSISGGQIAHGGCDRSAEDAYSSMAPDPAFAFVGVLSTVFLLMLTALPLSMIAVGSTYRNECPLEPRLPIYLLVGGSFGLIKVCLLLWNQKKTSNNACADEDDDVDTEDAVVHRTTKFTGFILSLFLSVWFVMGNIWFYKIHWMPNFEQPLHEPSNWCHVIVFRYTFYQLVTCYGLLGLAVLTTTCFISYYCCKKYTYIK